MNQSGYITSLTPLRGIAALWVVLFHIDVSLYYRDLGALIERSGSGLFSKGYLWVDFFFLLSGFIIAHVYGNKLAGAHKVDAVKTYLWARFARIYPLHLFTLLVLVLITPIVAYSFPSVVDDSWRTYFAPLAIIDNLLLINAMNQHEYLSWNIVSWSIGAEWWTYIAIMVIIIPFWRRRFLFFFGIVPGCIIGLTALVLWLPANNLDITFNYGFFRCLFEFGIGIAIYFSYSQCWGRQWLVCDLCCCLLCAAIVLQFHQQWFDLWVVPLFSLLILAVAYNDGLVKRLFSTRPLQYLGVISYSVYLLHGIWFLFFWFLFPWVKAEFMVQHLHWTAKITYVFIFLACTLVSAHFTYRYIELPGRRWFKPSAQPRSTLIN